MNRTTFFGQQSRQLVATTPLRFGVLGPLMVWRDGRPVRVAAAKHRSVLGILLASPNRTVRLDRLVDELWPEAAPATARKTIQGYIWRLRRALEPCSGLITTDGAGYRIVLPADGLDALEFERSVSTARAALAAGATGQAVDELTRAVRLWRGPAFACMPRPPVIEAHAVRLDEQCVAAQELLIAARLSLGDHAEVVPDLAGLAAAHPHREPLQRYLMIGLYRSGRRLDALEVFRRLRDRLAADHGLDPDRATTDLHQAILRDAVGTGFSHVTPDGRPWSAERRSPPPTQRSVTNRRSASAR